MFDAAATSSDDLASRVNTAIEAYKVLGKNMDKEHHYDISQEITKVRKAVISLLNAAKVAARKAREVEDACRH